MVYVSPYECPRCVDKLLRSRIIQVGKTIYKEYYCINCGYTQKEEAQGYGNQTQDWEKVSSV
jgi:ribosomal protein S27AE